MKWILRLLETRNRIYNDIEHLIAAGLRFYTFLTHNKDESFLNDINIATSSCYDAVSRQPVDKQVRSDVFFNLIVIVNIL